MITKPFTMHDMARHRAAGYWEDDTLDRLFAKTAKRVPDRIGIVDPSNRFELTGSEPQRLCYRQMAIHVQQFAEALRAQGLGPGSLIAVQLPNIVEQVLIYLACSRIGAVVSPISMAHRTAELRAANQVAEFDAYVSLGKLSGRAFYLERRDALPAQVIKLGIGSGLPQGVTRLDDGVKRPVSPAHPGSADDLFAIFWTSGTEGVPKAVPKTHNNMMASSHGAQRILDLPDGANVLAPFPFVNAAGVGGLMMCWARTAGALVLHHPFKLEVFVRQLADENIAYTMVAPTLLGYLRTQQNDETLRSALKQLIGIGTGSAPPDPEVFDYFSRVYDVQILNFFGSNEGAQMCATRDRVADPAKRASFFPRDGDVNWSDGNGMRTANGGQFKLIDPETGQPATAAGSIGEMWITGPSVMPGYYTKDGLDRAKFDAEGFFATADLFRVSDCGTLIQFHARARELISRGGVKISPVELDNCFASLPGVVEAAVASYADQVMGEKVCIFVVPKPGQTILLSDVTDYCDELGLAKFKWPERLITLTELPRTQLAKLDRRALTEKAETHTKGGVYA